MAEPVIVSPKPGELLPCPFCGSEGGLEHDAEGSPANWYAYCCDTKEGCPIGYENTIGYPRRIEATTAWNKRSSPSETVNGRGELITRIIREVAELPDRTSPEDRPEMMLVSCDELEDILEDAIPSEVTAETVSGEMRLDDVADAIDNARYQHPTHPRERSRPWSEADPSDQEYARRLARAALSALSRASAPAGADGWKDIASAPKPDGTFSRFMVNHIIFGPCIAYWSVNPPGLLHVQPLREFTYEDRKMGYGETTWFSIWSREAYPKAPRFVESEIDLWRPLPAPPPILAEKGTKP